MDEGRLGRLIAASAYINWYRAPEYNASAACRGALINQAIHTVDLLRLSVFLQDPACKARSHPRRSAQTARMGRVTTSKFREQRCPNCTTSDSAEWGEGRVCRAKPANTVYKYRIQRQENWVLVLLEVLWN